MKKIILNTKTYIGPLDRGNIDFYTIYKNQLYIISEEKLQFILDYLKIQFPNKSKIGFDISKWLHENNLFNENFLFEISSRVLNIPKDFSENDVYYYLSNNERRKDILFLFLRSLKNAYLYSILKNRKEDFLSLFIDFLKMKQQNINKNGFIKDFYLFFLAEKNHIFSKEIENMKFPQIVLKDNFFFERIGKFLDVISSDGIYKYYFFPKRYNLEFLIEEENNFDLENILKNMQEINSIRLNFEQKIFRKNFLLEFEKVFKCCKNSNFSFLNFDTVILLTLFLDEKFDIKINNKIYKFFKKTEILNYFTNIKISFIVSNTKVLEPYNYAKTKIVTNKN